MILSVNDKNAMLQGLADKLNVGANADLIVYIDADIAVTFAMPNPIEQSIVGGVLTFRLPAKVLATISGIPTSAKLTNSAGSEVTFNMGSEIVLDKAAIFAGGYVGMTGLTITI